MAILVDLEHEHVPWAADGESLELTSDANGAWSVWVTTFLLALRDKAVSIHFHSWRGSEAFSYIVDNTRYTLECPPPKVAEHMAEPWRARMPRGFCHRVRRTLWPRTTEASGVCTVAGGWANDWHLVCWSLPHAFGVDLHLLSLQGRLAEPHEVHHSPFAGCG